MPAGGAVLWASTVRRAQIALRSDTVQLMLVTTLIMPEHLIFVLAAEQGAAPKGFLSISPPVLFFILGVVASLVRSNLRMPKALTKSLSLYLMWAIGFKGGVELTREGLSVGGVMAIVLAFALAIAVPLYSFPILRSLVDRWNAAALTGVYGSVSVVTFLTASAVLQERGVAFGGHMVAAMTLMEFPAIVIALILLRMTEKNAAQAAGESAEGNVGASGVRAVRARPAGWAALMHEALLNGPVLLLLGSLTIGALTGERGYAAFKPLCTDVFPGVLAFFLLDMGLLAAARMRDVLSIPRSLVVFAVVAPLFNAALALAAARVLGVMQGDAVLLAVLAASASYIAAPAALRLAIPQAKPSLYISLSLGVTFPFNIAAGIPLYLAAAKWLW